MQGGDAHQVSNNHRHHRITLRKWELHQLCIQPRWEAVRTTQRELLTPTAFLACRVSNYETYWDAMRVKWRTKVQIPSFGSGWGLDVLEFLTKWRFIHAFPHKNGNHIGFCETWNSLFSWMLLFLCGVSFLSLPFLLSFFPPCPVQSVQDKWKPQDKH